MKSVLITGAYGGMGKACASLLAKKGFKVFALDIKTEQTSENIIPIEADITNSKSIQNALEIVRAHTKELYAIIHFAGIYMLNSLVEMEESEFDKIYKINLKGAYLINKAFLPMLKKESRIIITTSELANLDPLPFTGIYAIMKGALDKYAYSLRMELQLLDIKVSVLRAGAVNTGMLGASTTALDKFCDETELYNCNAARFKSIVEGVEARHIKPEKLAQKILKILTKRNPAFAYSINRNPLLCLLNILPKRLQFFAIKQVLKAPKQSTPTERE